MSKLFYRGFEVVNTKQADKKEVHDLVYRGVHYDPTVRPASNDNAPQSKLYYRGVAA